MLPFQDRYSRQRKLPEVGKRGQQRIEALSVVVRGGPEALIEIDYLERAGVGHAEYQPGAAQSPPDWPHAAHFSHVGPRNVALGAWGALRRIREALTASDAQACAASTSGASTSGASTSGASTSEPSSPNPRDPS